MQVACHDHLSFYPYDYEVQWLETTNNGKQSFEIPCVVSTDQHIVAEIGVRINCSIGENYFIGLGDPRLMFAYNHLNGLRLSYKTNTASTWAIPNEYLTIDPDTTEKFFDCALLCDYSQTSQSISVNGVERMRSSISGYQFVSDLFSIKHLGAQAATRNRFKYCKLYADGKKILDLIPVVKNGRGCVFDRVSQICYEPSTEENFTIGPTRGGNLV